MANTLLPTNVTATTAWATLGSLLSAAGIPGIDGNSVTSTEGYIRNNDTALNLYIGQGNSAPTSTFYATIGPKSQMEFAPGMNVNQIWIKAASSTISTDFVEGAQTYQPPLVNGVIAQITATENIIPKANASGDLVVSNLSDSGTLVTSAVNFDVDGSISTEGVVIEGSTSGATQIIATAIAGDTTLTLPAATDQLVARGTTDTLTNKTLTSPVINGGTGNSLTMTGAIRSSGPTGGIGYNTGAGAAVTQSTDKSTTVVSNTITTAITMNNAALNTDTAVSFTFTNSTIAITDQVVVTHQSAGTSGAYVFNAFPGAGSAVVTVRNVSTGNLSEAIVLRVSVYKAVSA